MKTRKLMFGAAYYPEYLPYDRVDTDLAMMKRAGMNTIRIAESTWSTLEPRDGEFDFSCLDRTLAAAKAAGIGVIVGTPTYAIPPWLAREHPEAMALTKRGRELYGRRQTMDIMDPAFRFHAGRVIRKLLEHTAGHPSVVGFQIDNETKYYGTASERVQKLFREYLVRKFGTTENLNRAFGLAYWSNSIGDWEDLPDLRGCVNGGLACEFDRFRRSLAAGYLKWQAAVVSEYKRPDQFITHNFDFEWRRLGAAPEGCSYGVQPEICHREASEAVTVCGADIYHPSQDDLTGAEIAFCGDSTRCLKQKNYLVLETQAQAFKEWTPYPGQLRLQAYSHLASGADGILYWNWHSLHNGCETYWKGLLNHDFAPNPAYEEACRIGAEWKRLGPQLCGLKKENRIALAVDNLSLSALEWFPIDRGLSYNDVVRWMYDSLYESNMECDVVDVHGLEPEKYRMIVTPALYCAGEETLARLEKFVERGGVLVSSFKSFVADEHLSVWPDTLPHRLHRCFGCHYSQTTAPRGTTLLGREVDGWAELLVADGAETLARYRHRYWGAYAGITRGAYGKGFAYYIGCHTAKETLKEILLRAAADAGLAESLPKAAWPVIVRSGTAAGGAELHYLLHYRADPAEWECPYARATDLLTGESFRKGERIPLGAWGVRILQAPAAGRCPQAQPAAEG